MILCQNGFRSSLLVSERDVYFIQVVAELDLARRELLAPGSVRFQLTVDMHKLTERYPQPLIAWNCLPAASEHDRCVLWQHTILMYTLGMIHTTSVSTHCVYDIFVVIIYCLSYLRFIISLFQQQEASTEVDVKLPAHFCQYTHSAVCHCGTGCNRDIIPAGCCTHHI